MLRNTVVTLICTNLEDTSQHIIKMARPSYKKKVNNLLRVILKQKNTLFVDILIDWEDTSIYQLAVEAKKSGYNFKKAKELLEDD